ncbi:hypothetical protein A3844_01860 [Paenibacillus helianthi]|uniref:Helix-turn-helix domain-containing protein n=1 Tax=Paenibacillus helianthi TaxID=1349432 RepID=A0ABX3EUK0_9BACL|nr:hypothetical protein [Paenibacillus helianthi]OKP91883.1 hypothetical protein A3844_01860 [Paenibacillus helianthi]
MTESAREPTMAGLLNQYEAIGGPEEYGPEGIAIMVALWRKSCKLGWKRAFQMTNTELTLQTGIKSRDTINTHRSKLVNAGLIGYTSPPRGSAKGSYTVRFDLIVVGEPVQNSDYFNIVGEKVVQKPDYFIKADGEPVRKLDHFPDTVLKDLSTTITTTTDNEFADEVIPDRKSNPMIELLDAYTKLHGKLDFHVKPREREAMGKMVAGGTPNPFTIRTMELLLEEKRKREGGGFKLPTSFLYYVDGIEEAWKNSQTTSAPTDGVAPGELPEKPQRKTKQQQEIDELQRFIEEEERREQTGSR